MLSYILSINKKADIGCYVILEDGKRNIYNDKRSNKEVDEWLGQWRLYQIAL